MGCPFCGNSGDIDCPEIKVEAKREDVPFAYVKDGKEHQASVTVIQPVHTCKNCNQSWTDQNGEVIRELAVSEAREQEMKLLKDCPCCGLRQSDHPDDLIDSLHPTGSYWTEMEEEGMRHYPNFYKEGDPLPKKDGMVWKYNCRETIGGCGLEIRGDSREEVIQKWNRRK